MPQRCDYEDILRLKGIQPTPHRLAVLGALGDGESPLCAREIMDAAQNRLRINRVTVYRILDLLAKNGLVERISSGDRSYRYGLAAWFQERPHAHFYCRQCGHMTCLRPEDVFYDPAALRQSLGGVVDHIEIRLDGTCDKCLVVETGE